MIVGEIFTSGKTCDSFLLRDELIPQSYCFSPAISSCQKFDKGLRKLNSHSAPAGRMVYNIYGLWGGSGEVVAGSNPKNR